MVNARHSHGHACGCYTTLGRPRMTGLAEPSNSSCESIVGMSSPGGEETGEGELQTDSVFLPTSHALTENPNGVQSSSPGLPRTAAATTGGTLKNPTANCEAARSAKFIRGHPIRPIRPIHPILPRHPSYKPWIKVENSLSPTHHKPIIRPENKGTQSNTNRHKPKFFISCSLHEMASGCYSSKSQNLIYRHFLFQGVSSLFKHFYLHHFFIFMRYLETFLPSTSPLPCLTHHVIRNTLQRLFHPLPSLWYCFHSNHSIHSVKTLCLCGKSKIPYWLPAFYPPYSPLCHALDPNTNPDPPRSPG
jgi:hypothetical protein